MAALEWVGQLLKIKGRVLPMSSMPLEIEAEVTHDGGHEVVRGQVAVATTAGHVDHLGYSTGSSRPAGSFGSY